LSNALLKSSEHMLTVLLPLVGRSTIFLTEYIAVLQPEFFLKPICASQLTNEAPNLSKMQCSNTLDRIGLIVIPLKSSQLIDFVLQSFNLGTGTM